MSNLAKLEFIALDITGKTYLSWILDGEIHLATNGLWDTIKFENMKCNHIDYLSSSSYSRRFEKWISSWKIGLSSWTIWKKGTVT